MKKKLRRKFKKTHEKNRKQKLKYNFTFFSVPSVRIFTITLGKKLWTQVALNRSAVKFFALAYQTTNNYGFLKHWKKKRRYRIQDHTYQQRKKLEKASAAESWWQRTEGKLQLASRTNPCRVPDKNWLAVIRLTSQYIYFALFYSVTRARSCFPFMHCESVSSDPRLFHQTDNHPREKLEMNYKIHPLLPPPKVIVVAAWIWQHGGCRRIRSMAERKGPVRTAGSNRYGTLVVLCKVD